MTMAQWVALLPIFKVCAQDETRYEDRGKIRAPWWWQMAAEAQLRSMLKYIWNNHGSRGNGNQACVEGGGIIREITTASDGRILRSGIGDGRR